MRKRILPVILYIFVITILPFGYFKNIVVAKSNGGYMIYNTETTAKSNKFSIKGDIQKAVQYDDCLVVITRSSVYVVKNNVSTELKVMQQGEKFYITSFLGRSGNEISFVTSDLKTMEFILYKVDILTGVVTTETLSKYLLEEEKQSWFNFDSAVVDNTGNKWLSYTADTKGGLVYKLLRINKDGTYKVFNNSEFATKDSLTNLFCDSANNIWFSINTKRYDQENNSYYLMRLGTDGVKVLQLSDMIRDYKVTKSNEIWISYAGKITKNTINGALIKGYYTFAPKIYLDKNDGVWVENYSIEKYNPTLDTFETRIDLYEESVGYSTGFSPLDDSKSVYYGEDWLHLENGATKETIKLSSHVQNNSKVVNVSATEVAIYGTDSYNINSYVTKKDNTGAFISSAISGGLVNPFIKVAGNNNELYMFTDNGWNGVIYKLMNNLWVEHASIPSKPMEYNAGMQVTSDGVYTVVGQKVYKVDNSKNVTSVDLGALSSSLGHAFPTDVIKDKFNNVYLVMLVSDFSVGMRRVLFKINNINDIQEVKKSQGGREYLATLLNEKNELEFIYSETNGEEAVSEVYYTDGSGNLVKDERFKNEYFENFVGGVQNIAWVKKVGASSYLYGTLFDEIGVVPGGRNRMERIDDFQASNSVAVDGAGGVYVGSENQGVAYFPPNYEFKGIILDGVGEYSVSESATPVISAINCTITDLKLDGAPYVQGSEIKISGVHNLSVTAKDSSGAIYNKEVYFIVRNKDINGDGNIDISDIATMAKNFNTSYKDENYNPFYDLNDDYMVNLYDFVEIAKAINNQAALR